MAHNTSADSTLVNLNNQPFETTRESNDGSLNSNFEKTDAHSAQPQPASASQSKLHSQLPITECAPERSMTLPSMGQLIRRFTRTTTLKLDNDYIEVPKDIASAPNGSMSSPPVGSLVWRYVRWFHQQDHNSKPTWDTIASGSSTQVFETLSHPYWPDIEIKSKRRNYGHRVWKPVRAVMDTGCGDGNWVSIDLLLDLGITHMNMLTLSPSELIPATSFSGVTVEAKGAVMLTWRGIQSCSNRGSRKMRVNMARNFKMRFLVTDVKNCPFQMIVGAEDIARLQILGQPVLALPKPKAAAHNIVRNPEKPKEVTIADVAIEHHQEKVKNEKQKEALAKRLADKKEKAIEEAKKKEQNGKT